MVLGVLFTLILYNYFHPHSVVTIHPYAIAHLDAMMDGAMNTSSSILQHTVQDYRDKYRDEILSLSMDGTILHSQPQLLAALRPHEKVRIVTHHFDVLIDVKAYSQHFALFDFWSLLLVLLLLPVLLRLIYDDVHAVVSPIERMCRFVTNLASDPMSEINSTDSTTLSSSLSSLLPPSSSSSTSSPSLTSSISSSVPSASLSSSFSLDSFFVELTLQKLAILLQLVFGSAGANIIANNIRGDYLEVVTPGRKVYAIFAFMGVEGWDDMMEVLQVEMSELMNVTAELVHSVCVLFGGEVNKNIGNAFLLVWKLEAEGHAGRGRDGEGRHEEGEDGAKEEGHKGGKEGMKGWLAKTVEKVRRRSHQSDERAERHHLPAPLHPSTSFPHSLTRNPPTSPGSDTSPALSLSPSPGALRPRALPSSTLRRRRGAKGDGDTADETKEPSPPPPPSPPSPVHLDPEDSPLSADSKRRNSVLTSMLSLQRRDLGSIFSRSTMNLFGPREQAEGGGGASGAAGTELVEAPLRKMRSLTGGGNGDHLLPAASMLQHSSTLVDSPLSRSPGDSFYARTHPTPPQPPHPRRHHGWKVNVSNHRLAEQALSSFLLTLLQLSTSPSLLKWRSHPLLAEHHLSLQFGIGLHVGWAIEGAIGSSHKIDASYLSPNVNLSSRLSVLCHHYHLPLLFSSAFYALLGVEVQKRCRKVDVVSVKGSRRPVGIYTFDIDFGDVTDMERGRREEREREERDREGKGGDVEESGREPSRAVAVGHHASFDERMRRKQVKEIEEIMRELSKATQRTKRREEGEGRKEGGGEKGGEVEEGKDREAEASDERHGGHRRASAPDLPVGSGLQRSSSSSNLSSHSPLLPSLPHLLSSLQSHLPPAFIPLYNAACSCYIDGDWRSAGRLLVRVLNMRSGDGPSQLLLKVMAKEGFRAPTGWKGYRALTKK